MNNPIKYKGKTLLWLAFPMLLPALIFSCSKMDDYKKFTNGGEITYTGKIDSVKAWSGRNRVVMRGLFLADPKVSRCVIYWNNKADSIVVPVLREHIVDTLNISITNVKEGVQNFLIYTYDKDGNRSIPVYVTGRAYGDRYQSSLANRGITIAQTNETGQTAIIWQGMDRLTGVFATEVTYTNINNVLKTIKVPINIDTTIIADFKPASAMKYRTLFLPDTVSIDTFSTAYVDRYVPKFLLGEDITATYIKNAGAPIRSSKANTRWGVLADWTTSASMRNVAVTGDTYGGFEIRGGAGVISMEAGWGLPDITNGLIYQTITLPAGTYSFRLGGVTQDKRGVKYIVAAEGTTLPSVATVPTASLAYVSLAEDINLNFTLTETKTISIGFAATLTGGTGSDGLYTKITSVKLFKASYL